MKVHVAKFTLPDRARIDQLNMFVMDGTSYLAPSYPSFEQNPGTSGIHLLDNGMLLVHNSAHFILISEDEDRLRKLVADLSPKVLTLLTMDTDHPNPHGRMK